jgi:hypothetical protein
MDTFSKFQVTPVTTAEEDIKELWSFDQANAGFERGPLIDHLLKSSARSMMVHDVANDDNDNNIKPSLLKGFGIAKYQGDLLNVGPIVSTDETAALALCQSLTEGHDGPIRMDVYESQKGFVRGALDALGFQQDDRQAIMVNTFGNHEDAKEQKLPGNRQVMFCPASQAWL